MFYATQKTSARTNLIAAMLLASSVAACATPDVKPTGFLTRYEALQESDERGAVRVATSTADILFGYTSIIIEAPTMADANLAPERAAAVRDALHAALTEELGVDREVVSTPMAGTLRLRYAVVDVGTSNVAINALTTPLIGAVDYGSLAIEAEVVDALSGERIAAMTWARGAKPGNVLGAYAPTGNARALAPDFAKRLAKLLSPKTPA